MKGLGVKWRMMGMGVLVGLGLVWLVWMIRPFLAQPVVVTPAAEEDGGVTLSGTLAPEDGLRIDLDETDAAAREANPLWMIKLAIMDAETERPLWGQVTLAYVGADGQRSDLGVACAAATTCRFGLPGRIEDGYYLIGVTRQGYARWEVAFDGNTRRTRTINIPVRLVRAAPTL